MNSSEGQSPEAGAATPDVSQWVALYWDGIYKLLYRLSGGSRHEAEELSQETFLRAIERQASFTPGTEEATMARVFPLPQSILYGMTRQLEIVFGGI